jgi:YidC/Oxa1 family membrane protein insertase
VFPRIIAAVISAIAIAFTVHAASTGMVTALQTEKLRLAFLSGGSSIVQWAVHTGDSFEKGKWKSLLTSDRSARLLSRHLSLDGIEVSNGSWVESKDKNEMIYTGSAENGRLTVRKIIKNTADYRLVLKIEIENTSDALVELQNNVSLVLGPGLGEYPAKGFGVAESMYSFVDPAVSVDGGIIGTHEDFSSQASSPLTYDWFGLHSRYFALLLLPIGKYAYHQPDINLVYPKDSDDSMLPERYLPLLSINLKIKKLNPGQIIQREFLVFSGPKSTAALKADDVDFSGVLFFGIWSWMAALCFGMLWVLKIIYGFVSNWGLSIILLAVLVRIVIYPITSKVLSSQKAFAEVQKIINPEMQAIKETYRGGEQSERILELYKKHGVSPFAGLKPLLIVLVQLPIFIALFHVLGRAFELRSASFLWIETLAEPDRLFKMGMNIPFFGEYFNVLPVLMAVTTLLTIKLSPAPAADKSGRFWQNIFLIFVAIAFFLLFYTFPSGMVLYWTMANVLHLLQQFIVESVHKKTEKQC